MELLRFLLQPRNLISALLKEVVGATLYLSGFGYTSVASCSWICDNSGLQMLVNVREEVLGGRKQHTGAPACLAFFAAY